MGSVLSMSSRAEITSKYAGAYAGASKKNRGRVLDQVVEVTGWSRDNARRRLKQAAAAPGRGRQVAERPPEAAGTEVLLRRIEGAAKGVGVLGRVICHELGASVT